MTVSCVVVAAVTIAVSPSMVTTSFAGAGSKSCPDIVAVFPSTSVSGATARIVRFEAVAVIVAGELAQRRDARLQRLRTDRRAKVRARPRVAVGSRRRRRRADGAATRGNLKVDVDTRDRIVVGIHDSRRHRIGERRRRKRRLVVAGTVVTALAGPGVTVSVKRRPAPGRWKPR